MKHANCHRCTEGTRWLSRLLGARARLAEVPGISRATPSMPDLRVKVRNAKVKELWIGHLCKLLEWNRRYPPTPFEKRRNDRVMELQGNRSPFIDHFLGRKTTGSGIRKRGAVNLE